ncbi:MAG: prolipoprotein diacylglyceryl transferase [Hyphomonadaceae bacterium]|nr:prolipoprotein diacylglyceryl transferase [Hyphomonadaceae bacterium]
MIAEAMQFPNIDPVALHLGTLPIGDGVRLDLRWYALAYIAGLFLGWRWMVTLIRRDRLWAPGKPAMSVPQTDDFLFWATLGVILGGRLGYVLFYKPDMIWNAPLELLQIWQGGMSFHGGLIGVAVAAIWFTRQRHVNEEQLTALAKKHIVETPPEGQRSAYERISKLGWIKKSEAEAARTKARTDTIDLLRLGDLAAAAAPIGLFFGRIANFINGELWGRTTDGPFGMVFCNETLMRLHGSCPAGLSPRFPSQLYEAALEGLALFAIINIATLKFESLRRPGLNVGLFLLCYGLFRAILETVREPDAHMPEALRGVITMGMLLSIPMILIGAWLIWRASKQSKLAAA